MAHVVASGLEPITRKDILRRAEQCVCGDRERQYGSPENNFGTIARFWSTYLQGTGREVYINSVDVAAMLAMLKIARIASGKDKPDNWVDLAGYAACGGELEAQMRIIPLDDDWIDK